jgi:hypothetical protein
LQKKFPMKRNALLVLAILTATGLLAGRADAASAVAIDPHGHLTRAYDPFATEEAAKQRALELAVHHGWLGARILASTGRFGYCAIALAYKRDGGGRGVIGVSLGQRTQAEADQLATAECLKGGGYIPKIYARFKG